MHEVEKISRILNEMVNFALTNKAKKVLTSIEIQEEQYKITLNGFNVKATDETIKDLKRLLNRPRRRSVEEYYWELTGESDTSSEMELVGMMVDQAIVEFDNGDLYIELHRLK